MAAITSAANGFWRDTATWTGGVVPGNGDTVTLSHNVDVDDARVVGTSPTAGNNVLAFGTTGKVLTIKDGGTLSLRGDANLNPGRIVIDGGGTLQFDATAAAAPTTTKYRINFTTNNAVRGLFLNGTSNAKRAVLTSVTTGGAANGYLKGNIANNPFDLVCVWGRLSNLGDAAQDAMLASGWSSSNFSFTDTVVESTVWVCYTGVLNGVGAVFRRTQWLSTSRLYFGDSSSGATHTFEDSVILAPMALNAVTNLSFDNVMVAPFYLVRNGQSVAHWDNVFIATTSSTGPWLPMMNSGIEMGRTYFFQDSPASSNPHGLTFPALTTHDVTIRKMITDSNVLGGVGDQILLSTTGTYRWKMRECINLPGWNGANGTWINVIGSGTVAVVDIEHCTLYGQINAGGCLINEPGAAAAGDHFPSLQSNLCWRSSSGDGGLLMRYTGTNTVAAGANVGHNNFWNITGPTSITVEKPKIGYGGQSAGALFTGTLDALTTDIAVDPQFVDATRDLRTYAATIGGYSGTDTQKKDALIAALTAFPNVNDANYNAAVSIADIIDWVCDGFVPTNPALIAAHDSELGGWIGAMRGVAADIAAISRVGNHIITSLVNGGLAR